MGNQPREGGGLPYKKDVVPVIPFRAQKKKWFWYVLGCSSSKRPQQELLQYLLGYWAEKKMLGNNVLFQNWNFFNRGMPRPQNRILVPLKGSFQKIQMSYLSL